MLSLLVDGNPIPIMPTGYRTIFLHHQMMFAIITPALIVGAIAERMNGAIMLFVALDVCRLFFFGNTCGVLPDDEWCLEWMPQLRRSILGW
jgi:ammonia channel protein AmtB